MIQIGDLKTQLIQNRVITKHHWYFNIMVVGENGDTIYFCKNIDFTKNQPSDIYDRVMNEFINKCIKIKAKKLIDLFN